MEQHIGEAAAAAKSAGASAVHMSVFGASVGAGVLGGLMMIALDPPKTKKQMFVQSLTAAAGSIFFGPAAVRTLDHYVAWIDLSNAGPIKALEIAAPVYFLIGALAWGFAAALVRLRHIIEEKGGDAAAGRLGIEKPKDLAP